MKLPVDKLLQVAMELEAEIIDKVRKVFQYARAVENEKWHNRVSSM